MCIVWFAALEYVGPIPYDILKPVLECCTPTQLFTLEEFNPVIVLYILLVVTVMLPDR